MSLLDIRGLRAAYGRVQALQGVDLCVAPGECVGVLGPNGAGKSTLLKAITGLVPWSGSIQFDGIDLAAVRTERLAASGLVMVPETRGIFAPLTVAENLELGAWGARRSERMRRRDDVHALFPRLRDRAAQPAGSLSGGEQQMLAIGRAMMAQPRLLLLDEPSLGLAPRAAAAIMTALASLSRAGLALLLVEQKAPLALRLVRRVYMLSLGRVVAEEDASRIGSHHDLARYYLA